jgi:uncharacterized protein YcfJ
MTSIRPPAAFALTLLCGTLAAPFAQAAEYATVVSSVPVVASLAQPRQVCSDSQQLVQARPSGVGAVIGAIAGGVLGNGIGGGFGRAAATGLGVVAGSVVGNQVEANSNPVSEVPVRRCQTVMTYEPRTIGYDVTYDYAGQRYSARMARDPGAQFAVSVRPADGGIGTPVATASGSMPVPLVAGTPAPAAAVAPAPAPAYYDPLQSAQPVYYAPQSVYYPQQPGYYPAPGYIAPVVGLGIGFGVGYYGGYRGGYHGRWH